MVKLCSFHHDEFEVKKECFSVLSDSVLINTRNATLQVDAGTLMVPILGNSYEVGAVWFGTSEYLIDIRLSTDYGTIGKVYAEKITEPLFLIGNVDDWSQASKEINKGVPTPEELQNFGFKKADDVTSRAEEILKRVITPTSRMRIPSKSHWIARFLNDSEIKMLISPDTILYKTPAIKAVWKDGQKLIYKNPDVGLIAKKNSIIAKIHDMKLIAKSPNTLILKGLGQKIIVNRGILIKTKGNKNVKLFGEQFSHLSFENTNKLLGFIIEEIQELM